MNVLIFNFLLYFLSTIYWRRKYGFTIVSFLWLYHTVYSLLGIIVVSNGVYAEQVSIYNKELSYIPYILNYICVYLMILPLKNIRANKISLCLLRNSQLVNIVNKFILIVCSIYLCIRTYEFSLVSSLSFEERYVLFAGEGKDVLNSVLLQYIRKFCGFIYYSSFPFIATFIVLGIINKSLSKRQIIIRFIVLLFPLLISCILSSNRAELYLLVFRLFFFVFLYFPFFSPKIKRKIIFLCVAGISLLLCIVLSISASRFDNANNSVYKSILRYLGETYPNLGYVYWEQVKVHPMGKMSYPQFYYLFSDKKPLELSGFFETYSYWEDYTGVPVLYFKSIFCDFYIEFGWCIALLLVIIVHYIFKSLLCRKRHYYFYDIVIAYFYFIICCHAVIGNSLGGIKSTQILVGILVLSKLMKTIYIKQSKWKMLERK